MGLVLKAVENYLGEFHERGIKIVILGRREGLRQKILKAISKAESETSNNQKATLALCFNYSGQEEIIDAAKQLLKRKFSAEKLDPQAFAKVLYQPFIPAIDLVIRTSGEQRLSNFMLWRAAYAELYFSPKYWPDFTTEDLDIAMSDYSQRQRRYGK